MIINRNTILKENERVIILLAELMCNKLSYFFDRQDCKKTLKFKFLSKWIKNAMADKCLCHFIVL